MKAALTKLIDVKSLMSISVIAVFVYLAITKQLSDQLITNVIIMTFSFFLGAQSKKEVQK